LAVHSNIGEILASTSSMIASATLSSFLPPRAASGVGLQACPRAEGALRRWTGKEVGREAYPTEYLLFSGARPFWIEWGKQLVQGIPVALLRES
jgi:hypothetical protein